MSNSYEAPGLQELGDFHRETGEGVGDFEEQVLPLEDYSQPGT